MSHSCLHLQEFVADQALVHGQQRTALLPGQHWHLQPEVSSYLPLQATLRSQLSMPSTRAALKRHD